MGVQSASNNGGRSHISEFVVLMFVCLQSASFSCVLLNTMDAAKIGQSHLGGFHHKVS